MRINILFLLVFASSVKYSFSQEQDSLAIPSEVMTAFTDQYKDTSNVHWKQVGETYVVEFLRLGDPFIVEFSEKGKWISSKETIMRRQVEDDLIDLVEESYPEYGLERFFNFKNNKEEEFVIFELTNGQSALFVRQDLGGSVVPLN